jgi:hypothetical protein
MKFYNLEHQLLNTGNKIYPLAKPLKVSPEDWGDLDLMAEGKKISRNKPIHAFTNRPFEDESLSFDCEWIRMDIYTLFSNGPKGSPLLLSEKAKQIFEQFILHPRHIFCPVDFIYKEETYAYYFLFDPNIFLEEILVWGKSEYLFCKWDTNEPRAYNGMPLSFEYYSNEGNSVFHHYPDDRLVLKKAVVNLNIDYYLSADFNMGGNIVSERLKNAIEAAGFEGIEFKELDIEFEVLA